MHRRARDGGRRGEAMLRRLAAALPLLAVLAAAAAAQDVRTAVEREARGAQRSFESFRRQNLPRVPPSGSDCDLTIGRLCLWDDSHDPPLPPEPATVVRERQRLSARLALLADSQPSSDFIAGQRVRYLLEAGEDSAALAGLARCAAAAWWCMALRGLVWHDAGLEAPAASAFDSALAAMPDSLRCRWLDVHVWLPPGVRQPDCGERGPFAQRVFWLAAPLLTWRAEGARNEFLARRTLAMAVAGTATPEGLAWGTDILETAMRFGWPRHWAREEGPPHAALADESPSVVGHEPWPSFSLMPARRAVEHPPASLPGDWVLTGARQPTMRYAPGWIVALDTLPVQIARFRGAAPGSMTIVAAFDGRVRRDSLAPTTGPVRAGLLLSPDADSAPAERILSHASLGGVIVLSASARPALGAVEVVDSARGWAARWRGGITPLERAALVSDLLVGLADSTPLPPVLDSAAPRALGALRVMAGATLALYWEMYVRATPEHPVPVTLRLVRARAGGLAALGRLLGLSHDKPPLAISWLDAGSSADAPGRTLRVAIPDVPPGRYRLEVVVNEDAAHGRAARDLVVVPDGDEAELPR